MNEFYKSTRGKEVGLNFEEAVLRGLASDKGLFVPNVIPTFSVSDIEELRALSFSDLAFEIIRRFISQDNIPDSDLRNIVEKSFSTNFQSTDITPVVRIPDCWVLELFHGPTFAFKDIALQFLGNVFDFFLTRGRIQKSITILGATSGDTGSAAIHGLRGKANVECYIMFPKDKVTKIQELQMTTVPDANVHCVSVLGDFDDCQSLVKQAFGDEKFRDEVQLGAINSINWARVLAQIVYYFYSYYRVTDSLTSQSEHKSKLLNYAVPTGNFGDILAGFYAKRMGLPIDKLIVCTNKNDVLHRFLKTGVYKKTPTDASLAPSMDISVSSNFERYLYYLADENATVLREWMDTFEKTGELTVSPHLLARARADFLSQSTTDSEILQIMQRVQIASDYLVCPHTATAMCAVKELGLQPENTIVLATAHPMKFEDAVKTALSVPVPQGVDQPEVSSRPFLMEKLFHLPVRKMILPNALPVVQSYIRTLAVEKKKKESPQSAHSAWDLLSSPTGWLYVSAIGCVVAVAVMRLNRR